MPAATARTGPAKIPGYKNPQGAGITKKLHTMATGHNLPTHAKTFAHPATTTTALSNGHPSHPGPMKPRSKLQAQPASAASKEIATAVEKAAMMPHSWPRVRMGDPATPSWLIGQD